jgi:hypothetical protein
MINLQAVFDMIASAFHETDDYFHWGDNAIIQGSLENLPSPDVIKSLGENEYFALIDVGSIVPEEIDSPGLFKPNYHYSLVLCHQGKVGDVTKIRNDMMSKFLNGWYDYWNGWDQWDCFVDNVIPRLPEIEATYDCLAIQITGTLSEITTKGGRIEG